VHKKVGVDLVKGEAGFDEIPMCFGHLLDGLIRIRSEGFFSSDRGPEVVIVPVFARRRHHDFMIPNEVSHVAHFLQLDHKVDDAGRVRASVDQVAEEDDLIIRAETHLVDQGFERGETAVNIANGENATALGVLATQLLEPADKLIRFCDGSFHLANQGADITLDVAEFGLQR